MISTLLPKILEKTDPAFSTVHELGEVLEHAIKEEHIRNIAVTGPFGSGKSSVLKTLMKEYPNYNYLPISLATLRANEKNEKNDDLDKLESLNRKIEYSIVQQLIYRETDKTVPNSRLKRIKHFSPWRLGWLSISTIIFILCLFVLFEPSFARVESFYQWMNFGRYNVIFDVLSLAYVLIYLFFILRRIIQSYAGSKLNKLNLKDAEIQVVNENSIFNKHLDEILYFFQATKYNVVVIEDLDRFNNTEVFLKLRELNQLVNESKIVNRHIVFIYSVKDDLFVNEDRTKFFDYITTVIPVINSSNAKDKLKEELSKRDLCEGIQDADLSEIAFFIQDMRLLTNIVNEFEQYKRKLSPSNSTKLDSTKLLAMIVYKNYYPDDFAQLNHNDGKVYKCLKLKPSFIDLALKELSSKEEQLTEEKKHREDNMHLRESDLRLLFLVKLKEKIHPHFMAIQMNNRNYDIQSISKDKVLFDKLVAQDTIVYQYNDLYTPRTNNVSITTYIKEIEKEMNFTARINAISEEGASLIHKQEIELENERLSINSMKFNKLITKYHFSDSDKYRDLELPPLVDVFLRLGYIDEDYFDYISYFYEGTITSSDRDLLLAIKTGQPQQYTYHIERMDGFIKELKPYMFESQAILNNDLMDYLAEPKRKGKATKEMFLMIMKQLKTSNPHLAFLSQYYMKGNHPEAVFTDLIDFDRDTLWDSIIADFNETEEYTLIEAFLKYCRDITPRQQVWINNNFSFLIKHRLGLGNHRALSLIQFSKFTKLNDEDTELLNVVVANSAFEINRHNLCLLLNHINPSISVSEDGLELSDITESGDQILTDYIKQNLATVLPLMSQNDKEEPCHNLILVINNDQIPEEEKKNYLLKQINRINSLTDINTMYQELAFQSFILFPSWHNIHDYYIQKKSIDSSIASYINKYAEELSMESFPSDKASYYKLQKDLLLSDIIELSSYKSIAKAFKTPFNNEPLIGTLDPDRVRILNSNNLIPFNLENVSTLSKNPSYVDYLISKPTEFIKSLDDYDYSFSPEDVLTLLKQSVFSLADKESILEHIDESIIVESPLLVNQTISIILQTGNERIWTDSWYNLISKAENKDLSVKLLALLIKKQAITEQEMINILSFLGDEYYEIAERRKKPVLPDNHANRSLLEELNRIHFISSVSNEKNGIRVNPRR